MFNMLRNIIAVSSLTFMLLMGGITFSSLSPTAFAGTEEEGGGSGNESNNGGSSNSDSGRNDKSSEPETESEPEPEQTEPEQTEIEPEETEPTEPQPGDATDNTCMGGEPGIDGCPPEEEEPEPVLPTCDGSAQDCVTHNGDVCLEGQGGHECECSEDMSDCPLHPSLLPPPVEEPTCPPDQFPVTPGDPSSCVDCEGPCPEPVPPTEEGPDGDCLFHPNLPKCASDNGECPPDFFQNEDGNCVPNHPNGCPEGFHSHEDDETGRCIPNDVPCEPGFIIDPDFPTCSQKEAVCRDHPNIDECKDGDDNNNNNDEHHKTIIINKIITEIHSGKHHDAFPEIDIIGLSTKADGDSMVCLMDIDSDDIQCQDFGMPSDRVNGDFWRVIETNHDKDFDNGNTDSNDVDDAIDAIKSQDFSELDDLDNHDFGVDLAWIAINPEGDGFVCLTEDSSGKGPSSCEPFKVSSTGLTGQITEGVEFS